MTARVAASVSKGGGGCFFMSAIAPDNLRNEMLLALFRAYILSSSAWLWCERVTDRHSTAPTGYRAYR